MDVVALTGRGEALLIIGDACQRPGVWVETFAVALPVLGMVIVRGVVVSRW